jgi:hypothetical protein
MDHSDDRRPDDPTITGDRELKLAVLVQRLRQAG